MRKLLIFITITASALSSGCSTVGDGLRSIGGIANVLPNAFAQAPLIYRPEIQQGNVISQEQINELKPGMTKRQVRFILGTPMLSDVFHADRWDYAFTRGIGSQPTEFQHVTVYFHEGRLNRISGDIRPQAEGERDEVKKEIVMSVPDWEPEKKSFLRRSLDAIGLEGDEN